jgi:hypothetical protein
MEPVDFLILGAGWTSQFLIPLLKSSSITYAATTTTGHESYGHPTLPFRFRYDPKSPPDPSPYTHLPGAKTILITFPLTGPDQSKQLLSLYRQIHGSDNRWIQLGSTGIFSAPLWNDCNSPYDRENARAIAEDELLELKGCVLNLAGLYGGERNPRNWVLRVAKTKEEVRQKKALHLVHGEDVARGIVAVHGRFTPGKRWLVTDLRVNDWWDLIQSWGVRPDVLHLQSTDADEKQGQETKAERLDYAGWVGELMVEENVRSLPRSADSLGRVLDSRAFWAEMKIWPIRGRVS